MIPDLNMLHSRLREERTHLTKELKNIETGNRPTATNTSGGWFGRRDEQANEATELRRQLYSEEHLKLTLIQIEHALNKFDDGKYGLCENCGQPIELARLEAVPYACLCVNCKAMEEKH